MQADVGPSQPGSIPGTSKFRLNINSASNPPNAVASSSSSTTGPSLASGPSHTSRRGRPPDMSPCSSTAPGPSIGRPKNKSFSAEILERITALHHSVEAWKIDVDKRLLIIGNSQQLLGRFFESQRLADREQWRALHDRLDENALFLQGISANVELAVTTAAATVASVSRGSSEPFGGAQEFTQGIYDDMASPALSEGVSPEQLELEFGLEGIAAGADLGINADGGDSERMGMETPNPLAGLTSTSLGPFSTLDRAILQPTQTEPLPSPTIDKRTPFASPSSTQASDDIMLITPPETHVETLPPMLALQSTPIASAKAPTPKSPPTINPALLTPPASSAVEPPHEEEEPIETAESPEAGTEIDPEMYEIEEHLDRSNEGHVPRLPTPNMSVGEFVVATYGLHAPLSPEPAMRQKEMMEELEVKQELIATPPRSARHFVRDDSSDSSDPTWSPGPTDRDPSFTPLPAPSVTACPSGGPAPSPESLPQDVDEQDRTPSQHRPPSPLTATQTPSTSAEATKPALEHSPLKRKREFVPLLSGSSEDDNVVEQISTFGSSPQLEKVPMSPVSHKRPSSPTAHDEGPVKQRITVKQRARANSPPHSKVLLSPKSGTKKKHALQRKNTGATYLDRRLKSQVVLRRSDGRKRGRGEWPFKGPNTRKGRLQEIICESCLGRCHWSCAGFDATSEPSNWACPDCQIARKTGESMPRAPLHECIRYNCILRENRRFDDISGDEDEYVVEKVLGRRAVHRDEFGIRHFEYLIKWAGYPMGECTWEPRDNLGGDMLIDMFITDLRNEDDDADRSLCRRVTLLDQAKTHFNKHGERKRRP